MYLSNILVFFQNCYIIFERIKTIKKTKFWNFIQSLENVIQKWEPYPISYQMLKNPWTNFLKRDQNLFLQTWKNQIKNKNLWLVLVQIATTIRHCYKVRRHQFLILSLIHTIKFCPCLNPTITTMKIIIIFTIPSWHKGQLSSEWIYEVIVSPKMPAKISQISALPSNKPPGQKSEKFLVGILGETMTS